MCQEKNQGRSCPSTGSAPLCEHKLGVRQETGTDIFEVTATSQTRLVHVPPLMTAPCLCGELSVRQDRRQGLSIHQSRLALRQMQLNLSIIQLTLAPQHSWPRRNHYQILHLQSSRENNLKHASFETSASTHAPQK